MSVIPSTEVIGHLKDARRAVRQVGQQLGYDPEIRPLTLEQMIFHEALAGLVVARYNFQVLEDEEYANWLIE